VANGRPSQLLLSTCKSKRGGLCLDSLIFNNLILSSDFWKQLLYFSYCVVSNGLG